MGEYTSLKMKRKEIEDVYDDFSDFSLSSPALKIRRLDAELPPIIEEPEPTGPPQDVDLDLDTEPSPSVPVNEERALVLYKPVNSTVSPNMCFTVNPDLIPGYKNGVFWSGRHVLLKSAEDKLESEDDNDGSNGCLAVVPWVSNPFGSAEPAASLSEPMEAEGGEAAGAMEIEEDYSVPRTTYGPDGVVFPQWQQQHCLTPQVPPNTATPPVMWSW